ncbi:hypothetical protein E5163_03155 [Marinicauda algicola]|uniref:LamG-like jellyroll fold domain-containing protein n=1 Tax=Marinicauda algicola TaxID=2029849 RepID=A0A4S2H3D0_9PROT|nr:LamG-like jellyroll fold domain-containing protein [Marinicauda algicola]TGY90140.1 hypothetical protein E5163_03155 [Marinicauda algicola]
MHMLISAAAACLLVSTPCASAQVLFDLDTLDGTNGFRIDGQAAGTRFSTGHSGIGDFNCDGRDDWAVSSLDHGVRVFFGQAAPFSHPLPADGFALAPGFVIEGVATGNVVSGANSGENVVGLGDLNADGCDDFAIGLPAHDSRNGAVLVVLGAPSTPASLNAMSALGERTILVTPALKNQSWFGMAVGAADFDANGTPDLLVGAFYDHVWDWGRGYIVHGDLLVPAQSGQGYEPIREVGASGGPATLQLVGESSHNEHLGWSVAGVGDVDGVPGDEVVFGAYGADNIQSGVRHYNGAAYLVFSQPSPATGVLRGSHLADAGIRMVPPALPQGLTVSAAAHAGWAAAGAGDIDQDGYKDFIVTAFRLSTGTAPSELYRGAAFLIYGGPYLRALSGGLGAGDPSYDLLLETGGAQGVPYRGTTILGFASQVLGAAAAADPASGRLLLGTLHPGATGGDGGGAWLVNPHTCPASQVDLTASLPDGCAIYYHAPGSGQNLSFLGDVMGADGLSEPAIGFQTTGSYAGALYVLRGEPAIDCAALPPGAVFYYRPETGLPDHDRIGGSIAASGSGTLVSGRYGTEAIAVNHTFAFPQADVDFADGQDFTVEVVARWQSQWRERNIVSKWTNPRGYRLSTGSDQAVATLRSNGQVRIQNAATPDPEGWYSLHAVADYGANALTLYNHGAAVATSNPALDLGVVLGSFNVPTPLHIHAGMTIDHVVVYDRALTPEEIAGLHDLPKCN